MASSELQDSWRRTTELLREARSHLSEAAEDICADEIAEFEDYLSHNELELALDSLEAAVFKSQFETPRILELLLSAAESTSLERHVAGIEPKLSGYVVEWRKDGRRETYKDEV